MRKCVSVKPRPITSSSLACTSTTRSGDSPSPPPKKLLQPPRSTLGALPLTRNPRARRQHRQFAAERQMPGEIARVLGHARLESRHRPELHVEFVARRGQLHRHAQGHRRLRVLAERRRQVEFDAAQVRGQRQQRQIRPLRIRLRGTASVRSQ
jgi:hypothetical protein